MKCGFTVSFFLFTVIYSGLHASKNPDLVYLPLTENEIYIEGSQPEYRTSKSREYLRFASKIGNIGDLPFIVFNRSGSEKAYQLYRCPKGTDVAFSLEKLDEYLLEEKKFNEVDGCRIKSATKIQYHGSHQHHHLKEIASYELRAGSPKGKVVRASRMISYRLGDSDTIQETDREKLPNYVGGSMLISPGYFNHDSASSAGQELDITGLASGTYVIVLHVNQNKHFSEKSFANNKLYVQIEISEGSSTRRQVKLIKQNNNQSGM